jgi:penicillin-binding protein 1A
MLGRLPSAPNRFSPITDPAARRRRDHVLARMATEGFITAEQADGAKRTSFDETLFTRQATIAPYFVEHVRQRLEDAYGASTLYNAGLKVYTTLNLKMQRAAEAALIGGLREIDKRQGYRPAPVQAGAGRGGIGPYAPKIGETAGTVLRVKRWSLSRVSGPSCNRLGVRSVEPSLFVSSPWTNARRLSH